MASARRPSHRHRLGGVPARSCRGIGRPRPQSLPNTAPRQAAGAAGGTQGREAPPLQPAKNEQAIAVLVNDEPITAYEIQQRTAFLALNGGGGGRDLKAKAEARWAQIDQGPEDSTSACRLCSGRRTSSRARRRRRCKRSSSRSCSTNMIEQIKREARDAMLPKLRKEAQERADRGAAEAAGGQAAGHRRSPTPRSRASSRAFAERNKLTEEQFVQSTQAGSGVDVSTLRERFRRNLHGARWCGGGARCWSPSTSATSSR